MVRKLLIGPGGVAAELGMVDPRRAKREKIERHDPDGSAQGDSRPGGNVDRSDEMDTEALIAQEMVVRRLSGARGRPNGRIRWYHRLSENRRCWAFTTTRKAWEAFRNHEPLSSKGTKYPDGRPVVPVDADPIKYSIRCGSCGTQSVNFLQLLFYAE